MMKFVLVCAPLVFICWALPAGAQYKGQRTELFDFGIPHNWEVASHQETRDTLLMELVRKGDDINNWKELITFEQLPRTKKSPGAPDSWLDNVKAFREKECPGVTQWNVIQQDEYGILYEWQLTKPCASAPSASQAVEQHEIARVVYGKYNIFVLHYAAKGPGLTPEAREKWLDWISAGVAHIDAAPDVVIPFPGDRVMAALKAAMESNDCKVTNTSADRVECKRPRRNVSTKGSPSGGEEVTAILESQGNQTRVRITTGFGFYGNFIKQNWSYPIFHQLMMTLQNPQPRT